MKRFAAFILAAVLLLSMSVSAFAETIDEGDSGSMEITYTTPVSYTVTIPAAQNFTASSLTKTGNVTASDVVLEYGSTLKITMKSSNNFVLKNGASSIAYSVTVGNAASPLSGAAGASYNVLTVHAGTRDTSSVTLTFATTAANVNAATLAGNHTDTLTFFCSVE